MTVRSVDGPPVTEPAPPGHVTIRRAFADGDVVELELPVEPRLSAPDPRIDAVRGCLVVERGPIVHCLESVDLAAATDATVTDIADVRLDPMTPLHIVDGCVVGRFRPRHRVTALWPYGVEPLEPEETAVDVALVPYHDWAERGPSTMRVWLPVA